MRGRLPVSGTFTGNGSTGQSFDVGFRPAKVEIYNTTDGDVKHELIDDGSTGLHFVTDAAVAAITSGKGEILNRGFSTGTDAKIVENNKAYRWIAY
jgi:hypothetical protein